MVRYVGQIVERSNSSSVPRGGPLEVQDEKGTVIRCIKRAPEIGMIAAPPTRR